MKQHIFLLALAAIFALPFCKTQQKSMPVSISNLPAAWREIDSLEQNGLPKSALEKVEIILAKTRTEQNWPERVKALLFRAKFQVQLDENGLTTAISNLKKETETAAMPEKAVLQSLLAQLYQQYLANKGWQIRQRTDAPEADKTDLDTWAVADFERESQRLYTASLADAAALKAVQLVDFQEITTASQNDSIGGQPLRPTLFDVLAWRAIEFFKNESNWLTEPAWRFSFDQKEGLAPAREFAFHDFKTEDSMPTSRHWLAVRTFQQILQAHFSDANPAALVDADLARLEFANQNNSRPAEYLNALSVLTRQFGGQPVQAEINLAMANFHFQTGQNGSEEPPVNHLKMAREMAESVVKTWPDSYAAKRCKSLIASILEKDLNLQVEEINLPDRPSLALVNFRNTDKIWCRIVQFSRSEEADFFKREDAAERLLLLKNKKPFAEFQTDLPKTDDHRNHSTEIRLPALPVGQFALLFADNQQFTGSDEKAFGVGFVRLKISNLAVATRRTGGQSEIIVMNRTTGEPLAGVKATFFQRVNRHEIQFPNLTNNRQKIGDGTTNELGIVACPNVPNVPNESIEAELTTKNDTFDIGQLYQYRDEKRVRLEAPIFTDRAIFRPGQTVFFKSILIEKDGDGKPKILPNEAVEIFFLNANQQEINKLSLSTNEYGSVNGSFVAPTGGLTGAFQIRVQLKKNGQQIGWHSVQIEEYKRPKFEVKINPFSGVSKLGDPVTVSGSAMNLAGSAVDGAKVVYRVTRGQKWSAWGGGGYYKSIWPREPEQQIAQGETTTDGEGNFKITFQAQGERGQNWQFTVNADVTDAAGETRSASTNLSISDRLLSISLEVDGLVSLKKLEKLTVLVKNQEGKDVASPVRLSIQAMKPEPFFKERTWGEPEIWSISEADYRRDFPEIRFKTAESKGRQPLNDQLWTADFSSEKPADLRAAKLKSGIYKFRATTTDANGKLIETEREVKIFDKNPPEPEPLFVFLENPKPVEPGESATVHVGSNDAGFVFVSIERGGRLKESKWLKTNELQTLNLLIEEADRGKIFLNFMRVRQGRMYETGAALPVPWTNKDLKIGYEVFRDKLTPGAKEEWRLKISGPKKEVVAAEMVAAMYDASLDQFMPNSWSADFWPDLQRTIWMQQVGFGTVGPLEFWRQYVQNEGVMRVYRDLNWFDFPFYGGRERLLKTMSMEDSGAMNEVVVTASGMGRAMAPQAGVSSIDGGEISVKGSRDESILGDGVKEESDGPKPGNSPSPRKNLQETAFFFPELRTDAAGNIILKFTMGEALTRWKFLAFAHTKGLETAFSEKEIVTQKELMVLPNPPRFLREGDEIEFVSRISNLSQQKLSGTARIELFDALTMKPVSDLFFKDHLVSPLSQPFSVEKSRSATVAWRLRVPVGRTEPVIWRITATAGSFSDGEENALPVVTNRMLVTESLVMSVRGGQTKAFELKNLSENQSRTLKHQQFTLEFTPNPAWYAVQSLPYLMEYPHECSEQLFNRFYANALASSVANSNPKIRAVFDRWKGDGKALASNLSKNQELKSAILEETPWVLAAQNEAQQKQQIALLFDLNKMADEQATTLRKLADRQQADGGFAWFPGGRGDWFITQEIVGGIGRLSRLKAIQLADNQEVKSMLDKAFGFCDQQMEKTFDEVMKHSKGNENWAELDRLGSLEIGWLYAHSMFSEDKNRRLNRRVFDFYLNQAESHWLKKGLQEQAMLALVLHRFGKKEAAGKIIASLRERSQQSEELGMYWNFDWGFYWFQLPIETQALMIEAFQDVAGDAQSVENQRVWLLKNKQTTNWKTTKATAAAVYALLIGNSKWLDETRPVSIKIGGKTVSQADIQPEAGTGYFKKTWPGESVKNEMGKVEVSNPNTGLAWGATFWQYFEDMDKVKSFRETPLKLTKQLFKMTKNERGPVLKMGDELHPGDRLTVRIELKVDRPMEYIHLKDSRASGFEPVDVISQYRWQDGLGYYQSTKDLATHFFIDYLPKGAYVFEYQLVVQQRGDFSGGVTTIQSMYAPEFSSHSTGGRVFVN